MSQQNRVTIRFGDDRMRAFLCLSSGAGQLNAVAILSELLRYGVVHGLNPALIHKMVAESVFDRLVEVARGTPVKHAVDARIEVLVDTSQVGRFSDFISVGPGVQLARRIPPVWGADGMDILGNVIKAAPPNDAALLIGQGTALDITDSNVLISARGGSLTHHSNGEIEVRESRKIEGDINASTGNVSFPGDLIITGTVHSGCKVEAAGSLKILGEVQDAVIRCGGDLILRGGVKGESNAVISAGRSMKAKFLENVKLTASEEVFISEDIINAKINTKGVLRARSIVGGNVAAAGGISILKAGNKEGVSTVLDIGAMCNYEREKENLVECINAQNMMNEGCISELFCFVRDNMDQSGVISEDRFPEFDQLKGNLTESMDMRREFEKSLNGIEELLTAVADSMIVAEEIYPNVLMKFGYSEHHAKERMTKISVKPADATVTLASWTTL